jgi:hypothetical protein
MKRPKAKREEIEIPKLCPEVKKKNGASGKRLIKALEDHLEECDEKITPSVDDNTDTE